MNNAWVIVLLCLAFNACVAVPGHKGQYIDDPDLECRDNPLMSLDDDVDTYREGSVKAAGGKSGGGCGCQ